MFRFFKKNKKNLNDTQSQSLRIDKVIEPGPKILREAAWNFLEDNIKIANNLVKKAMKIQPEYFFDHKKKANNLINELKYAVKNAVLNRKESYDNYSDEYCKLYWEAANRESKSQQPYENVNSMVFHSIMKGKLSKYIQKNKINTYIDFGCAYGRALYELSRLFKDCNIIGVDRQDIWKQLNEKNFQNKNLKYITGDIFSHLRVKKNKNNLLSHIRTGIMVYPDFLKKLYSEARNNGIKHILLYEIASLSNDSWEYKEQGSNFQSEAHRSTMFIHDYSYMLKKEGYVNQKIIKMPHSFYFPTNSLLEGDTYVYIEASLD